MRYLPLTPADRQAMLATIGAASIDDLFIDVPAEARLSGPISGLPGHASEMAVERHFSALARQNMAAGHHPFFLGCGAYKHHIPASVDHLIQRGEFLTAYTPYQPEIAQGTLQMLFEFQTQVARLYGCDVANASMYDGSTACWEAISMAARITKRTKAILSSGLHPHYVSLAKTMAKFTGDRLMTSAPDLSAKTDSEQLLAAIDADTSCVVVQYPDILGRIEDLSAIAAKAHEQGALLVAVVTEPVALGAIRSPGEMGADIVTAEGQSIGNPLGFGGPYVGLFAAREKFLRQMPGRLAAQTVDVDVPFYVHMEGTKNGKYSVRIVRCWLLGGVDAVAAACPDQNVTMPVSLDSTGTYTSTGTTVTSTFESGNSERTGCVYAADNQPSTAINATNTDPKSTDAAAVATLVSLSSGTFTIANNVLSLTQGSTTLKYTKQ